MKINIDVDLDIDPCGLSEQRIKEALRDWFDNMEEIRVKSTGAFYINEAWIQNISVLEE
jgi:hypothetical protein